MNRFGEEWKLFEDMDAPEKPLPPLPHSPPAPKHQRSIKAKSKTSTLINRHERRKRLVKPDFSDKKEPNEKSNETKIVPTRKRRRRKRNKVHKSPVNEPETAPNETLNYIWDQVETIGTNVYKYFWPEEETVPKSPKEKDCFE